MQELSSAGFLPIGDMTLEYRFIGEKPSHAPTIVMLHEGLGSIRTWGEFPDRLSERTGAGVFVYSRDGYGSSRLAQQELTVDYIRRHAREILPQILDAIGFRHGFLLGHSDGASMAAAYAGHFDDRRILGLILMAPHFCVEQETLAEIRNAREAFAARDLRQRLARYHSHVDAAFMRWNDVWLKPEFEPFNLRAELAHIRVPTLVMRGDDDRYGTHKQVHMAEEFCRCPLTTRLIPGCGHVPHREKPTQTLAEIESFYRTTLQAQGDKVPAA